MARQSKPARPWHDYRSFLERRYGGRVYRVPLDLGFGCPHRDPETLAGGCTFCGSTGSRAVFLRARTPLAEQVRQGLEFGRRRYDAAIFVAYFQAFTSTHAPVQVLRERVSEALAAADFRGIVISTRPDCLPPETLDFLESLTQTWDVWVELGIQSADDETLRRINRRHDFAAGRAAVFALAERGIHPAAHVILGLPGEGPPQFQKTACELRKLPLEGVKIHNLHVVRGTPLAEEWRQGRVEVMDEHEYAGHLIRFLENIPWEWPVMRLVSDTDPKRLLAPRWWMSKGAFIEYLDKRMRAQGARQGDALAAREQSPAARKTTPRNPGKTRTNP